MTLAPHSSIALKSVGRSRSQFPVFACGCFFPGHDVNPIRPPVLGSSMVPILSGWVWLVFTLNIGGAFFLDKNERRSFLDGLKRKGGMRSGNLTPLFSHSGCRPQRFDSLQAPYLLDSAFGWRLAVRTHQCSNLHRPGNRGSLLFFDAWRRPPAATIRSTPRPIGTWLKRNGLSRSHGESIQSVWLMDS